VAVTTLRLLTFNALMRGEVRLRLRELGSVLASSGYDVVCLQEVMYRSNLRLFARSDQHRAQSGAVLLEGGLVLLSRWPIVRSRFVRYPLTKPYRREQVMRKGVQLAVLDTPLGHVAVLNTHLSANRDDDWSAGNRYTAVARTELSRLAEVAETVEPGTPLVVAGDFNVPRDSATLVDFATAAGLRDALDGDTGPTYRPTRRFPNPPALDQILVRGLSVTAARPVLQDAVPVQGGREVFLSDHYGVEVELARPQ
jgi:endonuclease/exonuclease/phosphatase family metal-dependent hydrolase